MTILYDLCQSLDARFICRVNCDSCTAGVHVGVWSLCFLCLWGIIIIKLHYALCVAYYWLTLYCELASWDQGSFCFSLWQICHFHMRTFLWMRIIKLHSHDKPEPCLRTIRFSTSKLVCKWRNLNSLTNKETSIWSKNCFHQSHEPLTISFWGNKFVL